MAALINVLFHIDLLYVEKSRTLFFFSPSYPVPKGYITLFILWLAFDQKT